MSEKEPIEKPIWQTLLELQELEKQGIDTTSLRKSIIEILMEFPNEPSACEPEWERDWREAELGLDK